METFTMSRKEAPRPGLLKAALAGRITNAVDCHLTSKWRETRLCGCSGSRASGMSLWLFAKVESCFFAACFARLQLRRRRGLRLVHGLERDAPAAVASAPAASVANRETVHNGPSRGAAPECSESARRSLALPPRAQPPRAPSAVTMASTWRVSSATVNATLGPSGDENVRASV